MLLLDGLPTILPLNEAHTGVSGPVMLYLCTLELAYILFSYTLVLASTHSQTLIGANSYLPIHTTMTSSLIGLSSESPEGMLSCVI